MASSVNKVILIGNLARDPEGRSLQDGNRVLNMTVVTSERWRDKAGQMQERAEYHRVVVFNDKLADVAERFLRKGSKVYLEGSLQTRKWTDNAGEERHSTEVVLSRFRGELVLLGDGDARQVELPEQRHAPSSSRPRAARAPAWEAPRGDDLNDEIPF